MTAPIPPLSAHTMDPTLTGRRDPRLAKTAQDLEGLFVRQLYQAMRETVPSDGPLSGGPGEEMFTAMLHEHLADLTPARWEHGLAGRIAEQLARASGTNASTNTSTNASTNTSTRSTNTEPR